MPRCAAHRALSLRHRVCCRMRDDPASADRRRHAGRAHHRRAPRGTGGFGYDPSFVPRATRAPSRSCRRTRRIALSHRGQALRALSCAQLTLTELARASMMKPPPLSLYVHFPWCVRKCPYCDFNSHTLRDELPGAALHRGTAARSRRAGAGRLRGARSSACSSAVARRACSRRRRSGASSQHARDTLGSRGDIEVTLEANPGTIERGRFAEYRAAGINRVSLGAQSFDSKQLKTLGRIHSADETRRAAAELHAAGLDELQSRSDVRAAGTDRRRTRRLTSERRSRSRPTHISHYQLTSSPARCSPARRRSARRTRWSRRCSTAHCTRSRAQASRSTRFRRTRAPDARCVHNLNYWNFGDYLGVGAGAHGKTSDLRSIHRAHPADPRAAPLSRGGSP